MGLDVVELDSSTPYTAARARNAGFQFLMTQDPIPDLVQFVDGDCELADGWLARAQAEMDRRSELAAVCGRRREQRHSLSWFTRLCDLEWDAPAGEIQYFGGDVLVRASALRGAGGYNPHLIAGEEPELSLRLRREGWRIARLAEEMTIHDSNMTRFSQWWRRAMRAGHAYAEGAWLHGLEPERHWLRESLSIWFWGVSLPLFLCVLVFFSPVAALVLACAYPALVLRIYWRSVKIGRTPGDALLYAIFCVVAKFPQALGQLRFHFVRWSGRRSRLIEYKTT